MLPGALIFATLGVFVWTMWADMGGTIPLLCAIGASLVSVSLFSYVFILEGHGMWVAIVVGTVMSFALSGLKIWTSHRERMAKMEQDAKIAESMQ